MLFFYHKAFVSTPANSFLVISIKPSLPIWDKYYWKPGPMPYSSSLQEAAKYKIRDIVVERDLTREKNKAVWAARGHNSHNSFNANPIYRHRWVIKMRKSRHRFNHSVVKDVWYADKKSTNIRAVSTTSTATKNKMPRVLHIKLLKTFPLYPKRTFGHAT